MVLQSSGGTVAEKWKQDILNLGTCNYLWSSVQVYSIIEL